MSHKSPVVEPYLPALLDYFNVDQFDFQTSAPSKKIEEIDPLHGPITWYKISAAGTQVAQRDFQNKNNSVPVQLATCLCTCFGSPTECSLRSGVADVLPSK